MAAKDFINLGNTLVIAGTVVFVAVLALIITLYVVGKKK